MLNFFFPALIVVSLMVQILGNGDAIKCPLDVIAGICYLLGPTDFYFAFDSSNGSKLNYFRPLAASMLNRISELKIADHHRLSIFEAKAGEADLFVDRCGEKMAFDQIDLTAWLPNLKPMDVTGVFEMLDRQMKACPRKDFQAIVFVFVYGYLKQKEIRDYLEDFKENKERSIQIYIIYSTELYENDNMYESLLKDDLIHGCYHHKLPGNLISPDIEESAAQLMRCVCYKSEDCHVYDAKKLDKCFFVVENGTEKCVALFGGRVIFQPSQKLRPYSRPCSYTKECEAFEMQECVDDCALKKWAGWSKCQWNAKKKNNYRRRERMPNNQSLGQFSDESCPKWQEEPCPSSTTTKPMTRKISTTSRISTTRRISTTPKIPAILKSSTTRKVSTTRKIPTTPRSTTKRKIPTTSKVSTTRKSTKTPKASTSRRISTTRKIPKTTKNFTTRKISKTSKSSTTRRISTTRKTPKTTKISTTRTIPPTTPKVSETHTISTTGKIPATPEISTTPRISTTCASSTCLSTVVVPTTDYVSKPTFADSGGIYILVAVICTAATMSLIFGLICIFTRKMRKMSETKGWPYSKSSDIYKTKSISVLASIRSKTQPSEGDDGPGYLKKTSSDLSGSKATKSSDSPNRMTTKRTSSDLSIPTRIAPRKHIEGYIKFSPRLKKQ